MNPTETEGNEKNDEKHYIYICTGACAREVMYTIYRT